MKPIDRFLLAAIAAGLFLNAFKEVPAVVPAAHAQAPGGIVAVDIVRIGGTKVPVNIDAQLPVRMVTAQ